MSEQRRAEPLPLGGEHGLPYSKGLMARALMAAGLDAERAYELARRVEDELASSGEEAIELDRLHELAVEVLGRRRGEETIGRVRRFQELHELEMPIIVLIGGATGTGKSTVASEVAYRLGITRVTATDSVRETMRAFFSREFMPAIHYSSFEAGRALSAPEAEVSDAVIAGFLEQTRNVAVGVRAAMERALHEGWSMVLEGVHLVPGMVPARIEGALVVHCVLTIPDEQVHARHFWVRDLGTEGLRPVGKYLESLADIRLIQDYVVRRARRQRVPVIPNRDAERTVDQVIELVLARAERLERV